MRIHAFTVGRDGCFHYRIRQPLRALRRIGHWTSWGCGVDFETWDRADVLIGAYMSHPQTRDDWLRWCAAGEKLCVWDADDNVFTAYTNARHGAAYDDPSTLPRMREMISASHLVTVTTPELAEVYRAINPHVVVLRNCVPDWLIDRAVNRSTARPLILGYAASQSHAQDFVDWSPVLTRWMRKHLSETRFRLIGHDQRPENWPSAWPIDLIPWHDQTDEYLASLDMDVAIAPLSPSPFNAGKSGIKAQEAAALGIPMVAQDWPQYRDVIVDGETGFIARTHGEWLRAFERLWSDDAFRIDMGLRAREYARANFLQGDNAWRWAAAYQDGIERIGARNG